MAVQGKKFVKVLRVALILAGIIVASAVSYQLICNSAIGGTASQVDIRAARLQELQAEREQAQLEENEAHAAWERDFQAKMASPSKGPRALLENNEIEIEMYEAALRLQPTFARNPRHGRLVIRIILEAAEEHIVNPFIALTFASRESSLQTNVRKGSIGEQGLFQIHPRGHARRVCGKGRDMSGARANADTGLCYYNHLRELCDTEDHWVLVGAYGTGKCLSPSSARELTCGRRKRAELSKAVGEEQANEIWPL